MKEILKGEDLIAGEYYYCYDKNPSSKEPVHIYRCDKKDGSPVYIDNGCRMWASNENPQAFKHWRIFGEIPIPKFEDLIKESDFEKVMSECT